MAKLEVYFEKTALGRKSGEQLKRERRLLALLQILEKKHQTGSKSLRPTQATQRKNQVMKRMRIILTPTVKHFVGKKCYKEEQSLVRIKRTTQKNMVDVIEKPHLNMQTIMGFKFIQANVYSFDTKSKEEDEPCQCESLCGTDCLNRATQKECNPVLCPVEINSKGACKNQRFVRAERKETVIRTAGEKGFGLFATERITSGSFVDEYIGEVIDGDECMRRLNCEYSQGKSHYLTKMSQWLVIDATQQGNVARFINHSCNPNCEIEEWTVLAKPRIGIFATREIEAGEEITYNYRFQYFGLHVVKCQCGFRSCRGWI